MKYSIRLLTGLLILSSAGALFCAAAGGTSAYTEWTPGVCGAEGPDSTLYAAERDTLFALSPDGAIKWKYITPGYVTSPPAVQDSTVFIITGDRTISAVSLSGSLRWSRSIGNNGMWMPAIGKDGSIYIGGNGGCSAYSPEGNLLWKNALWEYGPFTPSTLGPDGTIYFTGLYYNKGITALNPDGSVKWVNDSFDWVVAPPALDYQGRIYVPTDKGLISFSPSGAIRWKMAKGYEGRYMGPPVIDANGTIYMAGQFGAVLVISLNGTVTRTIETGKQIQSGPVLGKDGNLYLCSRDGAVLRINPRGTPGGSGTSLTVTTVYETGLEITSTPILTSRGLLFFGMANGVPRFFQTSVKGYPESAPWPCFGGNPGNTRRLEMPHQLGAISGTVRNELTGEPIGEVTVRTTPGGFQATADSTGCFFLFGVAKGTYQLTVEGFGILTRTVENVTVTESGIARIEIGVPRDRKWIRWKYPLSGLAGMLSIDSNGIIYVGISDGKIYAINPDRSMRWMTQIKRTNDPISITDDGNLCYGQSTALRVTDSESHPMWTYTAGGMVYPPTVGRDGTVYFGCEDGYLYAVAPGGSLEWKCHIAGIGRNAPVIGWDGTLYVKQGGILFAVDPYGVVKWSYSVGESIIGSPALGSDGAIYITGRDRDNSGEDTIHAIDPTGKALWTYNAYDIGTGPVIGAGDRVYFGSRNELHAVQKGRLIWKYAAEGDVRTTAAVGSDGIVYFGTGAGMFYALTFEGYLTWRLYTEGMPDDGTVISPDGTIYFCTSSGTLFAIQTRSYGYPPDAPWPTFGKDNRKRAIADPPPHAATVSGTVCNTDDGKGIPGAAVRLTPGSAAAVTDSRGQFTLFTNLPGTYTITATVSGWLPESQPGITLDADDRQAVTLNLRRDAVWTKWKKLIRPYTSRTAFAKATAIGPDGTIYIPAWESILAINPDGSEKWSRVIGNWVLTTLAVASNGTIFTCGANILYSLSPEGKENWHKEYTSDYVAVSGIAIAADSVLYLSNSSDTDRFLRAIVPGTGEMKWQGRSVYSMNAIYAPPVVGRDGTIYAGDHGAGLHAFDPAGKEKWMYGIAFDYIDSPPAIGPDNTIYAVQKGGAIHAITPSGNTKWTYKTNMEAVASPIIGPDNTVYFVDGRGILYALDADGKQKWSLSGMLAGATPVLSSDTMLYVAGSGGKLLALDTAGSLKWSYDIGSDIGFAPKLAPDGTLYVYSADGYLHAVQTGSHGYPREPCWPCLNGNNRNTNYQAAPDTSSTVTGTVIHRQTGNGIANVLIAVSPGEMETSTDSEGKFGLAGLAPGACELTFSAFGYKEQQMNIVITGLEQQIPAITLEPDDYRLKWKYSVHREEEHYMDTIDSSVTLSPDGTVYFSNMLDFFAVSPAGEERWVRRLQPYGRTASVSAGNLIYIGSEDGNLFALHPDSTTAWNVKLPGRTFGIPAIQSNGQLLAGTLMGKLLLLDPDGSIHWEFPTGHVTNTPSVGQDGTIYTATNLDTLYAVTNGGVQRWSTKGRIDSPGIDDKGNIIIFDGSDLVALNPDGSRSWTFTAENRIMSSCAIDARGTIYFGDQNGTVYAVGSNGTTRWTFRASGMILSTPAIGSDGIVYFGDEKGLFHALFPDGTLKWSFETGGPITGSPAIAPDGTVYVGSTDGFLYAFETTSRGYQAGAPWPCYAHDSQRTSCATTPPIIVDIRDSDVPGTFSLLPNYPNPFNPSTTISFSLPARGKVTVQAYNAAGQKVDDILRETLSPGEHCLPWAPRNLAGGVYFIRIITPFGTRNIKTLLLK